MAENEVVDSPTAWVAEHISRYVASDGNDGYLWRGAPTLLLTTTGRKSGLKRRTALIVGEDGDRLVVVASKAGAPENPWWYENLVSTPVVTAQLRDEVRDYRARTAEGGERVRLWKLMTEIWPDYEQYQAKTTREIPVVVLEPIL